MIDLEKRKALIAKYPCFYPLKDEEVIELAQMAFEISFLPNEIITKENEIIDAIYLVEHGDIEVSALQENQQSVPIAIFSRGEAIGLSYEGFFSKDGLRKGTLTALTPVTLLGWTIEHFHGYLASHPNLKAALSDTSEMMLRMNFIKQAEPFEKLPPAQISWLAQDIEEMKVTAGTVVIYEGEIGESCYLIRSGQVRITVKNDDGTEKELAMLGPPMLFGESVLLTGTARNATATMVEEGTLLVLKTNHLKRLMRFPLTTEMMMLLMVQRSRPLRQTGITSFHRFTEDGHEVTVLKNSSTKSYFQLSKEGRLIWEKIDGRRNLEELTVELYKAFKVFAPTAVADTLFKLSDAGFIKFPQVNGPRLERRVEQLTLRSRLKKLTAIKLTTDNVDGLLTSSYKSLIYLLYTRLGQAMMAFFAILGFIGFLFATQQALKTIFSAPHLVLLLIGVFVANLLTVLLHELAHGYTTKFFKHQVNAAGIIIIWLGLALIPFVDTSDMWLSDKRSRIFVSLAGPYCDLIIAGVCGLVSFSFSQSEAGAFFWLVALTLYYGVYNNLLPLRENDGQAALKEASGDSYLQLHSFQWIARISWRNLFDSNDHLKEQYVRLYWLICGGLFLVALAIALFLHYSLLDVLPEHIFGISMRVLSWFLPGFIVAKFVFLILTSAKSLKMESKH